MPRQSVLSVPLPRKSRRGTADQVLPFDVTLAGANEYGAMSCAKIFGVEILNEGSGVSIDDAVTEMQATFVARAVEPMTAVASPYLPTVSESGA